jgi:hypothetical protein
MRSDTTASYTRSHGFMPGYFGIMRSDLTDLFTMVLIKELDITVMLSVPNPMSAEALIKEM